MEFGPGHGPFSLRALFLFEELANSLFIRELTGNFLISPGSSGEKSRENLAFAMTSGENNRECAGKDQAAWRTSKLCMMHFPTWASEHFSWRAISVSVLPAKCSSRQRCFRISSISSLTLIFARSLAL